MKAAARSEFLGQAVGLLGEGAVKTAPSDLEPYCTDWRKRFFGKAPPDRPVLPPCGTKAI